MGYNLEIMEREVGWLDDYLPEDGDLMEVFKGVIGDFSDEVVLLDSGEIDSVKAALFAGTLVGVGLIYLEKHGFDDSIQYLGETAYEKLFEGETAWFYLSEQDYERVHNQMYEGSSGVGFGVALVEEVEEESGDKRVNIFIESGFLKGMINDPFLGMLRMVFLAAELTEIVEGRRDNRWSDERIAAAMMHFCRWCMDEYSGEAVNEGARELMVEYPDGLLGLPEVVAASGLRGVDWLKSEVGSCSIHKSVDVDGYLDRDGVKDEDWEFVKELLIYRSRFPMHDYDYEEVMRVKFNELINGYEVDSEDQRESIREVFWMIVDMWVDKGALLN